MEDRRTRTFCGLSLVLLLQCGTLWTFNLDEDNVVRKNGDPGSLFGFSLAMHWQLQPENKKMFLVGAPTATALPGQKAVVTGGLYSCDLVTSSDRCTRVDFDNNVDLREESKENQWMGVTVKSQGPGGKIVTCAHRYQRRSNINTNIESRDILGRCYVLSQDLNIDPASDEDGGNWHFCLSRLRGHERFGSCQQGLSATFDKNYHYLIFGAPGAFNWKGVVRLEQRNNTLLEMGLYDDGPFEAGDENKKDPDLVPVPANSYLGFSLDSGMSLSKDKQLTVVAGAPRYNHSGAVVLLKRDSETGRALLAEYTLEGEGLASSFGYDLAVVDLNKDGWQDIVVGAPQYFEKDGDIGGAVYVYINKVGDWDQVMPIRINGPKDSMFGLAVENLGDINQDGYNDIAVGAPYDNNGTGVVYIYHGSAEGINSNQPAQVLKGKSLGVTLFGYSLAANMDLDFNSYPDLVVGSLSDSVFVYRARPVVSISKEIMITPKELDFTNKNCGNTVCMEIKACFQFTANPKNYNPKLVVMYSIVADAERRKNGLPPRGVFTKRSGSDYESKGTLALTGQGDKKCINQKFTLQENIRDKLRGIPIDVSVELQDSKRQRRQSSDGTQLLPVLDPKQSMKTRTEVNFLKEGCGTDNLCQSNLEVKYRYGYWKPNNKNAFTPLPLINGVPEVSLSDQKEIALEVAVSNRNGDDAHEASVIASFPKSLSYSTFRAAQNAPVICTANTNGSQADCELGNPFKRDSEVTFYIILTTAGISLDTTELEIDLQLDTTSEQQNKAPLKAKANVVIELQLSVSGQAQPSQVYFTGEVRDESYIKKESDIGSAIGYQFRIINLGKPLKDFATATLVIHWPQRTTDGNRLLYLVQIGSTVMEKVSCSPEGEINPLKVKKEDTNTRRRRSIGDDQNNKEGSIALLTDKRKYRTLSCGDGASCVEFHCPLRDMDSNAVITLHSRLWNSTFLKDFATLNYLEVIVKASLHVSGVNRNMALKKSETQVKVTVFPERRAAQYSGLPWWIILVAILLGLLLLGLLVFLLWKCGFFERAKYEDSVPSYNAVRIKREAREGGNPGHAAPEKKPWITTWNDHQHRS